MENKLTTENLVYQIALSLLPGVGDVIAKNLVGYCGGAEAVFNEKQQALLKIPNVGQVVAEKIKKGKVEALKKAEGEICFIEKNKIKPLFFTSDDYPKRLKSCNDSPILLYVKGNANLNPIKCIAFVGTRNATDYGKMVTENLIGEMAALKGIMTISGLAYGIDIAAHKASLKNNIPTTGVVAHGLDTIYPSEHRSTAEKMQTTGAVVSEFMSKTRADKENFPRRNRIIAGMVDAVIVVESGTKGGSLITAELANSYNRDVFAIPGNIDKEYSKGCNALIRNNKANLIQSLADIEYLMGWDKEEHKSIPKQAKLFEELSADEQLLVDFLKENSKADIDSICFRSGIKLNKIPSLLLNLELKGVIKNYPGKVYDLI